MFLWLWDIEKGRGEGITPTGLCTWSPQVHEAEEAHKPPECPPAGCTHGILLSPWNAGLSSNGRHWEQRNTLWQTFSFYEVSKLIMFPWLVLTGWLPTWKSRASLGPNLLPGADLLQAPGLGMTQSARMPQRPRKPDTWLKNVPLCLGLRINLFKMKSQAGNIYNILAFGVKLLQKKSILTLF